MSIYINGMEMPKNQVNVIAVINPSGLVEIIGIDENVLLEEFFAVPVPPHGRLIDADALRQSIKESIDECHKWANEVEGGEMYARVSQALGTFVECSLRVKAAPTIIPASEEVE